MSRHVAAWCERTGVLAEVDEDASLTAWLEDMERTSPWQ